MVREIVQASRRTGERVRYLLEVFAEGDHYTSTLAKLDERGEAVEERVAPRFYGITSEQARRRMITILENDYDEIAVVPHE